MKDNKGSYIVNPRYHITINGPVNSNVVIENGQPIPCDDIDNSNNKRKDIKHQTNSDTSGKRCCSKKKKGENSISTDDSNDSDSSTSYRNNSGEVPYCFNEEQNQQPDDRPTS